MEITTQSKDNVLEITPDSDLVASTVEDFRKKVKDIVSVAAEETIALNLSHVAFLDSTGLGAVVSLYKTVFGMNKGFYIIAQDEDLRHLFSITRLDKVFEIKTS